MKPVYITHAYRSPVGNLMGSLSSLSAPELAIPVIQKLLSVSGIDPKEISEVIMGQVLTGASGQNPARQTSIGAGLPVEVPAFTINKVCGSGLKSIGLAYESIAFGNADIIIAGGQESMSNAPHASYIRGGVKAGDSKLTDMMMYDGLTDIFSGSPMGITAENLAEKYGISRELQDEYAHQSQMKAAKAQENGVFSDEIVDIIIKSRKGEMIVSEDEFIKPDTNLEKLSSLRPAFKPDGTVTAGNSSGINDGAAAVIVVSEEAVRRYNLHPMARIASFASIGVDPSIMGIGPVAASRLAAKRAGLSLADIDLFELNEAFAAQSLAVLEELDIDREKVNVNGGSIAIGHPIGASGARITTSLLHEMVKRDASKALASLCVGGGMGIAMVFDRM